MKRVAGHTVVKGLVSCGITLVIAAAVGLVSTLGRAPESWPLCKPSVGKCSLDFPATDEEWRVLAAKCMLISPPSVSQLLHGWRLWAVYDSLEPVSPVGQMIRPAETQYHLAERALLDGARLPALFPTGTELFRRAPAGLSVLRKNRQSGSQLDGESHPGELLSTLAECRIRLDHPIRLEGAQFTVNDIVRQTAYDFDGRSECEFHAVGLAYYLAHAGGFSNAAGQFVSFDDVMRRLIDTTFGDGTCQGTHVCYAIAALLRLDRGQPFLSDQSREQGCAYLERVAASLMGSQHEDGAWRLDWPSGLRSKSPEGVGACWGEAVRVTGHHLEWMVLRPQPPLETPRLHQAIAFLIARLRDQDEDEVRVSYTDWSHAVRALALWREACRRDGRNS